MRFIGDKNVLIVAKCNVNFNTSVKVLGIPFVLIVAKCNVNYFDLEVYSDKEKY